MELWEMIFGSTAEISKSLKGTSVSSLLKPAVVTATTGGGLRFPDKPVEPKKPGGFA